MKSYICTVEKEIEQSLASHYPKLKLLKYMAALGLAEMIFPWQLLLGLCSGYSWAVLAQHQGCAYNISLSPLGWQEARSWRKHSQDSWYSNWPEGIFHTRGCLLSSKSKGRAPATGIEVLLPRKWLNTACWWKPFVFLCFSTAFAFALLICHLPSSWPTKFFHLIFSSSPSR